ncbi:hypothetical protein ACRAWD_19025 [Caulobacter segnis]
MAQRVDEFLAKTKSGQESSPAPITRVAGTMVLKPIDEMANVSTNQSSQWALNLFGTLGPRRRRRAGEPTGRLGLA